MQIPGLPKVNVDVNLSLGPGSANPVSGPALKISIGSGTNTDPETDDDFGFDDELEDADGDDGADAAGADAAFEGAYPPLEDAGESESDAEADEDSDETVDDSAEDAGEENRRLASPESAFVDEGEQAGVATGDSLLLAEAEPLQTRLEKDFLERLGKVSQAYPDEVRAGLKKIYGSRAEDATLEAIMRQQTRADSDLLPDKVFAADGLFLRGANGCYAREKHWIFLRSDWAEGARAKHGLTFERAEMLEVVFNSDLESQEADPDSGADADTEDGSDPDAEAEAEAGPDAETGSGPQGDVRHPEDFYAPSEDDAYESLLATFSEEMGHHLDEYIDLKQDMGFYDSLGDEGELFAILVMEGYDRLSAGEELFTEEELSHAWRDNDVGLATVRTEAGEFKDLAVEFQVTAQVEKEAIRTAYMVFYLKEPRKVDFHTTKGLFRYALRNIRGIAEGQYEAEVEKRGRDAKGENLVFKLSVPGDASDYVPMAFSYQVGTGQPNPEDFFADQDSVHIDVIDAAAPQLHPSPDPDPDAVENAMELCRSGGATGIKVFPYRGTRFGAALPTTYRDSETGDVIIKYPTYVRWNKDFKKQIDTLRTPADPEAYSPFLWGIRIKYNEIVRIHTYEPKWWDANVTGDTHGLADDIEDEFCATADDVLELGERAVRDTAVNVALTVVDAASFFIPVGKLLAPVTKPLAAAGTRAARVLAVSVMLGLRDAVPTAFGGIASRTATVLVEHQMTTQVAGRAVSQTVSHAVLEFSESTAAHTAATALPSAVGEAGVKAGGSAAAQGAGRAVTVTFVDTLGRQVSEKIAVPSGDAEVDAMINRAFDATFDMSSQGAGSAAAGQGVVHVAPEIAGGLTQANVAAFRAMMAKPFNDPAISVLDRLWTQSARAGDQRILNLNNSRALFDLQRSRFWTKVANTPEAKALFERAGCTFGKPGTAPVFRFNGVPIRITIDHAVERQIAPNLALTGSNLRLSLSRENSVVLRLLNQMDVFQHADEIERMTLQSSGGGP